MLLAYINVKESYSVLNVLLYFKIKIENCNMIFRRQMCSAKFIHVFMSHAYFYNVLFVGVYWKRNRNVKKCCNFRHLSNMSVPNKKKNEWELSMDLMSDIQYHCAVILYSQWIWSSCLYLKYFGHSYSYCILTYAKVGFQNMLSR